MSTDQFAIVPSGDPPRRGRGLAITALLLSLVALGLAVWTVLRPAAKPSSVLYSAAEQADAKAAACRAADLVRKGVSLNTNLQSSAGDVMGSLAVAANARLSLSDGGLYLINRLDDATPSELSDAVGQLAHTLMDIGAASTAGALNTDPDQAARLQAADTENAKVAELCR
jgi:hypothetical protein